MQSNNNLFSKYKGRANFEKKIERIYFYNDLVKNGFHYSAMANFKSLWLKHPQALVFEGPVTRTLIFSS